MSDPVVETPAPAEKATPAPEAPPKVEEKATEAPPKPKPGEFARKAQAERERVQRASADKAAQEDAKAARAEAAALKAELEKITARRASYIQNPVQALMDAFPGMEPIKAFEMIGEAARNQGKPPVQAETYELRQRLDAMEKQRLADIEAQKAADQKARQDQLQSVTEAFQAEIATFIKENAETYELTALYGQEMAVFEVMDALYKETGKLPTKKEAADKVEAKLEEMASQALKTKKIGAKVKPPEPETPKTLSNGLASQSTFGAQAKNEQERMARAIAALEKFNT